MEDDAHLPGCPKRTHADAHCQCEAIEDRMIYRASIPDPASLIRAAKAKGLLKPAQAYGPA